METYFLETGIYILQGLQHIYLRRLDLRKPAFIQKPWGKEAEGRELGKKS